jgi:hypothetical protein
VTLVFWIPRPPDNANARGHTRGLNRAKRAFWAELDRRAATRYHIPPPPGTPFARALVAVEYFVPNRRHLLDTDNAIRRLKPAIDWLVRNAYLAGDRAEQLVWTIPTQSVWKGAATPTLPDLCSLRLTLTELAATT